MQRGERLRQIVPFFFFNILVLRALYHPIERHSQLAPSQKRKGRGRKSETLTLITQ